MCDYCETQFGPRPSFGGFGGNPFLSTYHKSKLNPHSVQNFYDNNLKVANVASDRPSIDADTGAHSMSKAPKSQSVPTEGIVKNVAMGGDAEVEPMEWE